MKGWHKASIVVLMVLLLLAVIIPFLPRPARAFTYVDTYNFVDITSPSSTHQTWSGNITTNPLNDPPPSYAEGTFADEINERRGPGLGYSASEVDNAAYNALEASDDSRYITEAPGGSDNAALWHEFEITIDPTSITRLDIKWEGYQGNSSSTKLWVMIWNYEYGVFHVLNASAQTSDYEYTGSITSNCDHFYSSSNILTVLAYNDISGDNIYCDYVEVAITYGPPFTATFNTTLAGWGWSPDEHRGIGNVSFPVSISAVPRTDAPESSDIEIFGTLNLTYNDNTMRTFALHLTGVKTRSLYHLRQNELDTNGEAAGAAFNGPWLTWNTSGVEEHYIGGAGIIWLPHGNLSKTVKPYYFLLRTPAANISVGTLGSGFVGNVNNIIYSFTRGFDTAFTALMDTDFRDTLSNILDSTAVIVREVRDRIGPYIP